MQRLKWGFSLSLFLLTLQGCDQARLNERLCIRICHKSIGEKTCHHTHYNAEKNAWICDCFKVTFHEAIEIED